MTAMHTRHFLHDIEGHGIAHSASFARHRRAVKLAQALVSTPLLVYRLVMLAWALWLALAVIRWSRWIWGCFTQGGLWRVSPRPPKPPKAPKTSAPPASPAAT